MNLSNLVPRPQYLPEFRDWRFMRGVKVAITGARGTLGSLLSERLAAAGINFVSFDDDVTDAARLESWIARTSPTILFHLAAIVPLKAVEAAPARAMAVNATSLLPLIAAVAEHAPDCWMFYASTSHVYGSSVNPLDETSPTSPISLYGATKLAGEAILKPLAARLAVKLCVGRIFSFFHEKQDSSFLIPSLVGRIRAAPNGGRLEIKNSNSTRDFLYAPMVVDAMLHACKHTIVGTVNIASGRPLSVLDIAKRLVLLAGKDLELVASETCDNTYILADTSCLSAIISRESV